MRLVLDPPVGPYSQTMAIAAWLRELAEKRALHAGDPEALAAIERAEEQARLWLDRSTDRWEGSL